MTNHDTDPTTDGAMTFTRPKYSEEEVRAFFAPMLTDDDEGDRNQSVQPRCPCGCSTVEHDGHERKL